jgi:hypothetical protein
VPERPSGGHRTGSSLNATAPTRTVAYDWFLSTDGTECEVREAYVDADTYIEHEVHVREARDTLFAEFAYDYKMTIYGEPSPRLAEFLDSDSWPWRPTLTDEIG